MTTSRMGIMGSFLVSNFSLDVVTQSPRLLALYLYRRTLSCMLPEPVLNNNRGTRAPHLTSTVYYSFTTQPSPKLRRHCVFPPSPAYPRTPLVSFGLADGT